MPGLLTTNIKSLILDMDGVLWKGERPIGDLAAIFELIHARSLKVAFATNNGSQTPDQYVERLARLGVRVESWQVITSALCVVDLLIQKIPSGGPIFAIGGPGIMTALRENGFELLTSATAQKAKAVVMGLDLQIDYTKMCEAALLVRNGIPFYATNPDKTFPTPRGEIPGAGAWVSVIVTATGVEPIYAGKPAPNLINLARQRLGTAKEETLVVGDRLETDIIAGRAAGCPVALVLSGVSQLDQARKWRPKLTIIARSLAELVNNLG